MYRNISRPTTHQKNLSLSHFSLLPPPESMFPSFDIMLPESSQMKNLAGVLIRAAIRAF